MKTQSDLYRSLPAVDDLLRSAEIKPLISEEGQAVVADACRVVLGRLLWRLFAHQIGVASEPLTPLVALAAAVVGTLTIANVIAAIPGRSAWLRPVAGPQSSPAPGPVPDRACLG